MCVFSTEETIGEAVKPFSHCVEPNAAHFPGCSPTSANRKKNENKKKGKMTAYKEPTEEWEWIWTSFQLPFPVLTFWQWITMCYTFCYICRGSDMQIIMSVSLVGLILIHALRKALFRTQTLTDFRKCISELSASLRSSSSPSLCMSNSFLSLVNKWNPRE